MKILEYENLGIFIRWQNNSFSITTYKDEACTFGGNSLLNTKKMIDNELFGKVDFYRKGHLVEREIQ